MSGTSEAVETPPLVLVAGTFRVGKSTLIKGITGSHASSVETPWLVETKYYTATLSIREADDERASNSGRPEALVLVFNLGNPKTLGAAQSIAGGFDLEAVEVKVLCGTHADTLLPEGDSGDLDTSSQPPWFQEALDWSIEHGFEFVACCPAAPSADAGLALDGDKQGVARIVEVLHAHTWPNLVLLSKEGQQPAPAMGLDRASVSGTTMEAGAASAPPPPSSSEQPPQQRQDEQEQEQPPGDVEPGDAEPKGAEQTLDGLERLMEEMRGHKARLADLPDAERRKQAAAMALKMMQMLGLDEEGGSSGGGSGSGDEEL